MTKRFLTACGFLRQSAEARRARDLAEAQIALLDAAKMREYYAAMEAMLQRRIIRLKGGRNA